jgi:hypothetical protein
MLPAFTRTVLALATGLLAGAVWADDGALPAPKSPWTFGGFGTLGLTHADVRDADYTSNLLRPNGVGATRAWSGALDSRIGAQIGYAANKEWSAVLQVIVEQTVHGDYRPIVEWANIKYQPTPELALRLGRIALPMFLAADYRKAAYALPWVRTPVESYGAIPITNSNGVDLSYRWTIGELKHTTQVFYGGTNVTLARGAKASTHGLAGVSNTTDVGAASFRVSVLTTELSVDIARALFNGFRQFGAPGAAIADTYDVLGKRANGVSLGANYDPGNWFLIGELGRLNANSYLGDKSTVYISGGYRVAGFTPYAAFARVQSNGAITDPGLALTGLPPAAAAGAAALNAGLNNLLRAIAIQSTVTAGLRWDVAGSAALKVQFDRVRPTKGSTGTLINVQPGFVSGRGFNVLSLALDFVF